MSVLSYQIGYLVGTLCREALKALRQREMTNPPDYDLLGNIPTMIRRGINLFEWHDANVKPWIPKLIIPTDPIDIDD
ncbi:hypothetical protein AWV77_19840 [Pseudomonas palleroniana]|uniref:Uncharacterized protein n=1 Tax=Pseudomonas palleroniana TaxID=191390 RepID=A0A0X7K0W0_9PSED|nr:hypothetical protein AWV77_19840 [Pseudomonas palleroniana]